MDLRRTVASKNPDPWAKLRSPWRISRVRLETTNSCRWPVAQGKVILPQQASVKVLILSVTFLDILQESRFSMMRRFTRPMRNRRSLRALPQDSDSCFSDP